MARTVLETHPHPKYPRLRLDLRADSTFYQARTFLDGKQRQKSTETAQLRAAFKIAEDWYRRELRASGSFGNQHPIAQLTADPVVGEVFRQYLKDLEKKKQPEALKRWGPIQEFWRSIRLQEIKAQTFRDFYRWRRDVKPHTLHKDVTLIRQLLKHSVQHELLDGLPPIPTVGKIDTNPRPWLTPQEWGHLVRVSEDRIEEVAGNDRLLAQRSDLHDQMLFMVHSMVRVGEMQELRFRDCRFEKQDDGRRILIADVRGKRGHRTIVAPSDAASIIEGRTADEQDQEALVFPEYHRDGFRELLEAARLYRDHDGFTRNMKSLRATAISFRVMQPNANLILIARNAGTSVQMIDTFYAKRLSAEAHKTELGKSVVPAKNRTKSTTASEPFTVNF